MSHFSGGRCGDATHGSSRVETIRPSRQRRRKQSFRGSLMIMSLGQELAPHLPFLRRYARALTGSQAHGDAFVRATLEAIVAQPDEFPRDVDPRLGLYRTFHAIWSTANIEEGEEPCEPGRGRKHRPCAPFANHPAVPPGPAFDRARRLLDRGHGLSDRRSARRCRGAGRRGARGDRAADARRRPDHRGRADDRHGHRDDGRATSATT